MNDEQSLRQRRTVDADVVQSSKMDDDNEGERPLRKQQTQKPISQKGVDPILLILCSLSVILILLLGYLIPQLFQGDTLDKWAARRLNSRYRPPLSSIFDNFFGQSHRQQTVVTDMTMEDLYFGKKINLPVTYEEPCSKCGGRGVVITECSRCNGYGVVRGLYGNEYCPRCHGHGHVSNGPCPHCNGSGSHTRSVNISVDFPPGFLSGNARFYNLGDNDVVVVKTQEISHREFSRRGNDLIFNASLSMKEILLGKTIQIHHLNGQMVEVFIDSSTAQHLSEIRLKGLGLRSLSFGVIQSLIPKPLAALIPKSVFRSLCGDLVVVVHVSLPSELSQSQKSIINQLF